MADFVIKMADERGNVLEQTESGYSAVEVRDRFAGLGYLVYWVKPVGVFTEESSGFREDGKSISNSSLSSTNNS